MVMSFSTLQSMMDINAQAIHALQQDSKYIKEAIKDNIGGELTYFGIEDLGSALISVKKRAKILERNQRAMKAALMEAYEEENFQRAVKMLVDDLFSYPENLGE